MGRNGARGLWRKKKSTKTQTLAAIFRVNESLRGRLVEMKNLRGKKKRRNFKKKWFEVG